MVNSSSFFMGLAVACMLLCGVPFAHASDTSAVTSYDRNGQPTGVTYYPAVQTNLVAGLYDGGHAKTFDSVEAFVRATGQGGSQAHSPIQGDAFLELTGNVCGVRDQYFEFCGDGPVSGSNAVPVLFQLTDHDAYRAAQLTAGEHPPLYAKPVTVRCKYVDMKRYVFALNLCVLYGPSMRSAPPGSDGESIIGGVDDIAAAMVQQMDAWGDTRLDTEKVCPYCAPRSEKHGSSDQGKDGLPMLGYHPEGLFSSVKKITFTGRIVAGDAANYTLFVTGNVGRNRGVNGRQIVVKLGKDGWDRAEDKIDFAKHALFTCENPMKWRVPVDAPISVMPFAEGLHVWPAMKCQVVRGVRIHEPARPDAKPADVSTGAAVHPPRLDLPAPSKPAAAVDAPVLKKAIGIMLAGNKFLEIIPANRKLPLAYVSTFGNADDNQKEIEIRLAQQGKHGPKQIVDAVIDHLPPHPAGQLRVKIKVKVDEMKNLTLDAEVPESGYHKAFGPFRLDRPDNEETANGDVGSPAAKSRGVHAVSSGPAAREAAKTFLNRGFDYYKGVGGPADKVAAREQFSKACDGGMAEGCYNLGVMKKLGEGGPADEAAARTLFQETCDGGLADACYSLGVMKKRGEGGPADKAAARALYEKACDGGVTKGCFKLGAMKDLGEGGPADKAAARTLYKKACDGGMAAGCYNQGVSEYFGDGGPTDKAAARTLFDKACDGGMAKGCYNLGVMVEQGEGGTADKAAARALYQQACDGGYKSACSGK